MPDALALDYFRPNYRQELGEAKFVWNTVDSCENLAIGVKSSCPLNKIARTPTDWSNFPHDVAS
jgi:hypothetical protein